MQMKLWGIKKWMLLKNIGKNVTRKSTIFDIKNILVIYDLWFHSDKKVKNRFLNDELIWERTINTTESKASKKNPLSFSHVYEGPAWCGFMYNSWNRCSFSLLLNGSNRKGNDPPKSTQGEIYKFAAVEGYVINTFVKCRSNTPQSVSISRWYKQRPDLLAHTWSNACLWS